MFEKNINANLTPVLTKLKGQTTVVRENEHKPE